MWEGPDAVVFQGAKGITWHVAECSADGVPGARGPFCLIFFSEGTVRRIWDFPDGWRDLDPIELEALMG